MSRETSIKTPASAIPEHMSSALNQADAQLEALTADKDRLFAVIQSRREEVLLAALRNPGLDHQHLLALLKRRELGSVITAIYTGKRHMESSAVKFALVAHPDTPPHIAQTLIPLLYIFDLLRLCHIPGLSADIHVAAERKIVQQMPIQPLGNKLTLARRGTAAILDALLREGLQNVLEICLDNPHLKEGSLHQFLTSSHATAEAVSLVARNSRWKSRPNIRLAILKNPRTPLIWFTLFLPGLPAATVRDLLASPRLTFAQKELVRKAGSHSLRKLLIFAVMLSGTAGIIPAEAVEYATARISTPVMNTPDVKAVFGGANGRDLKVDRCGQVRELEYIALPGTQFTLLKKYHSGTGDVYQVATDEYPVPPAVRLYVDGRFLTRGPPAPTPRVRSLPSRDGIVSALRSTAGTPYVWGGNVLNGVPELTTLFYTGVRDNDRRVRELAGLDCSGLLYYATGGWTPRNTSLLLTYGRGVAVAGRKSAEIADLLQPLDLIVWNGHVIIVLDRQTAIESRLACGMPGNGGVVLTSLSQRIAEIMQTRRPANVWPGDKKSRDIFVVRRWYAP